MNNNFQPIPRDLLHAATNQRDSGSPVLSGEAKGNLLLLRQHLEQKLYHSQQKEHMMNMGLSTGRSLAPSREELLNELASRQFAASSSVPGNERMLDTLLSGGPQSSSAYDLAQQIQLSTQRSALARALLTESVARPATSTRSHALGSGIDKVSQFCPNLSDLGGVNQLNDAAKIGHLHRMLQLNLEAKRIMSSALPIPAARGSLTMADSHMNVPMNGSLMDSWIAGNALSTKRSFDPSITDLIGRKKHFPEALMDLLDRREVQDCISWLPHGKSFMIFRRKEFATHVLPRYFRQTKFESFTRKLNRWGFKQVLKGPDQGAFHHKLFRKDKPDLCHKMFCRTTSMAQAQSNEAAKTTDEPGDHKLSPIPRSMSKSPPMEGTVSSDEEEDGCLKKCGSDSSLDSASRNLPGRKAFLKRAQDLKPKGSRSSAA